MRYFQKTIDCILMYRQMDNLDVVGYSDIDFGNYVDSRNSASGCIFIMATLAISWSSVKQTLIATSTIEAKFILFFEATSQGV